MSFDLASRLAARRAEHLYRLRPLLESPQGPEVVVDGRPLLAFCSNDYLGLANHPEVIRALQQGAEKWGVGGGASHLVIGHSSPHHALEEALAEFNRAIEHRQIVRQQAAAQQSAREFFSKIKLSAIPTDTLLRGV